MATIAVTGSTGRLGGRVARLLADDGVAQRLLVRDTARAPRLAGADVVSCQYADPDACEAALRGIETVLMVSAAETPDRVDQHRCFIDAAVRAGVARVVYTSFLGAAPDATFTLARDHAATESHLRDSGLAFTFLRDNLYADFFVFMVGEDGALRGPADDGRVSAVAQDDIADAIVAVLRDPARHRGRTYDLTGPEALSFDQVAATLTAETGRAVRYERETIAEAYASRQHYDAPAWQVDAWVSTYTAVAAGDLAGVSGDIEALTGHAATPLAEILRRPPN